MDANKKYKCGHKRDIVIIDSNPITMTIYFDWKDSVGFDGDCSMCWKCFIQSRYNEDDEIKVECKQCREDEDIRIESIDEKQKLCQECLDSLCHSEE